MHLFDIKIGILGIQSSYHHYAIIA